MADNPTPPVIYVIQSPTQAFAEPEADEDYEEDDEGSSGLAWVICFLLVLIAFGTIIISGSPEIQLWLQIAIPKILNSFST